jgi:hypothetical protein
VSVLVPVGCLPLFDVNRTRASMNFYSHVYEVYPASRSTATSFASTPYKAWS